MSNGQWDFCARPFGSSRPVITIRGQRSLQDLQCWWRCQLWWLQKSILLCVESRMQRHHDFSCRRKKIWNFERGQNWRESSCWGLLHWPEHWSKKLRVITGLGRPTKFVFYTGRRIELLWALIRQIYTYFCHGAGHPPVLSLSHCFESVASKFYSSKTRGELL